MGENAIRIAQRSPEFVATHEDWPWAELPALRNRIAHDYFTLDVAVIWDIVTASLPDLIQKVEALGELDPRLWGDGDNT